jgi:hypothetical protein
MPKIPVDKAPAGSAIDIAVALALDLGDIFLDGTGWYVASNSATFRRMKEGGSFEHAGHFCYPLAAYSTDISAAWKLVQWATKSLSFNLVNLAWVDGDLRWSCTFGASINRVYAGSASLAICRAFLRANGVEYVIEPTWKGAYYSIGEGVPR